MIIITNIEYLEVPGDRYELLQPLGPIPPYSNKNELIDVKVVYEIVNGLRFKNPKTGQEICVGYDKATEEILGLSFRAFKDQECTISEQWSRIIVFNKEIEEKTKYIKRLKNASFWQILKWYFTKDRT